jgi:hypothetical protein
MKPFHWLDDATVKITATTSGTDRAKLLRAPTGEFQLEVYNSGAATVFLRKGKDATVTASASNPDKPIAPGATEVLTVNNDPTSPITHIAAVTATGSADIYFTVGAGL